MKHAPGDTAGTQTTLPGIEGDMKSMRARGAIAPLLLSVSLILSVFPYGAEARGILKVKIPRRSELTPVQRLNREGVDAVRKQEYGRASTLFYKAYLFDPSDPFTLNNLGYISELQGELDRARTFYALAREQGCTANIDRSNEKQLEGKPMQSAFDGVQDVPMRVNRMNLDAMNLLERNRGFEAIVLLKQGLSLDQENPFTLNNLGVADEMIGDYSGAMKNYRAVAAAHSNEPVAVTAESMWRGKSVSLMAAASAMRLEDRIRNLDRSEIAAAMLTLRGVFDINQNDLPAAREDFIQAYSLNPESAFALNNRGYVAEMDGDLETAQDFYGKARAADGSHDRVGQATHRSAEGRRLSSVAESSNLLVDGKLEKYSEERRMRTEPIELTPRGGESSGKPISVTPPAK